MLFFQSSISAKKQYYDETKYWFLTCEFQQENMSCSDVSIQMQMYLEIFDLIKSSTSLSHWNIQSLSASFIPYSSSSEDEMMQILSASFRFE